MSVAEPLKTSLHDWHTAHGGRVVEFGGWSMPVQYSTIVEEHRAVRSRVGLFDIGHMGRLRFGGPDVLAWLDRATTNHVAKLAPGQIQYSLMAGDDGGILDDLLVYRLEAGGYYVVCNASNRAVVVDQFRRVGEGLDASMEDETAATGMIAVQGPMAQETLGGLVDAPLAPIRYYYTAEGSVLGHRALISRTGYTGEDGFEVVVPVGAVEPVWTALLEAGAGHGILPCGLGARDTLRFEAAMCLYGHELSAEINPYAAGVGWAVKLGKGDFVGREAIEAAKASPGRTRVGLILDGKRIARQGAAVIAGDAEVGVVTSGTFGPTIGRSAAMALIEPAAAGGGPIEVDVRGHREPARIVPLPFYKRAGH